MQLCCHCREGVHVGHRTKGVSKHLGCHQESSPRGVGLPPRCLPCCLAPCLYLLTRHKSPCASVTPILHQRLTRTRFGCTQVRAARLSSLQLLLTAAPEQRACKGRLRCPASLLSHVRKVRAPLNSQVGTRNALRAAKACRNVQLETVTSGATTWEFSLGRGRQRADACSRQHGDSSYPSCHAQEPVTSFLKENAERHCAGGDGGLPDVTGTWAGCREGRVPPS